MVVDDGSNDDTAELIRKWQTQNSDFEIRYVYKENGGMHTAHNTAYELIDNELNVCIDSDDALAPEAVETILKVWDQIRDKNYAGIIGLDADFNNGTVIGSAFPAGMKETTLSGFYAGGGSGDKKLVYRTDIIKQTPPYPVFEGEKYVSLAYKYLLIDQQYKLYTINEILCLVEYQADGSSLNMFKQYVRNPKGFAFWRKVQMKYPESKKRLLLSCIHYCSSSFLSHNKAYVKESPKKLLTVLLSPAGFLLSKYISRQAKKG